MRELFFRVLIETEVVRINPEIGVPGKTLVDPVLVPFLVLTRFDEELHFHLLELAGSENKVPRGDFVAEAFPDLSHTEGGLHPCSRDDVVEIDEDPLSGLRSQIVQTRFVIDGPQKGLQKPTKFLGFRELTLRAAVRTRDIAQTVFWGATLLLLKFFEEMVSTVALVATQALHQRVREHFDVSGGLPDGFGEDHRGIQTHHVGSRLNHPSPPLALDVLFQFDT